MDNQVRYDTVKSLIDIGGARVEKILADLLTDEQHRIRRLAKISLHQLKIVGHPKASVPPSATKAPDSGPADPAKYDVKTLIASLAEQDEKAVYRVSKQLQKTVKPGNLDLLIAAIEDENPKVRLP